MENIDDNVIEVLKTVILGSNRRNKELTREELINLLVKAGGDPNKALDYYYMNGCDEEYSSKDIASADKPKNWTQQAQNLQILLGGDVPSSTILSLLKRANNDIEAAVDIYFTDPPVENVCGNRDHSGAASVRGQVNKDLTATVSSSGPCSHVNNLDDSLLDGALISDDELRIKSMLLQPLSPRIRTNVVTSEQMKYPVKQSAACTGTYSVTIFDDTALCWEIATVFGRLVVQKVDSTGAAADAGICKSDVVVAVNDLEVTRENCEGIRDQLLRGCVTFPTILHLRRLHGSGTQAPNSVGKYAHEEMASTISTGDEIDPMQNAASIQGPRSESTDNLFGAPRDTFKQEEQSEDSLFEAPSDKYGMQRLENVATIMMRTIDDASANVKSIIELLFLAELSTDVALNNYFDEQRPVPDFRQVVGHDWNPLSPHSCINGEVYEAEIPSGSLGLTVENMLERTVVVDLKPNGAAAKAGVVRSSWLVGLNGDDITNLTHKETLGRIEKAHRPLVLQLVVLPNDAYKQLRRQLSMNIRQPKTERLVPEQDRMSFRVFQSKIHQAIIHFPFVVCMGLYKFLNAAGPSYIAGLSASGFDTVSATSLSSLPDTTLIDLLQEPAKQDTQIPHSTTNQMSSERRFLLNLFSCAHDHEDKGENVVIKTILFLGALGTRLSMIYHGSRDIDTTKYGTLKNLSKTRYLILIAVILYVLESLSIIENHASWDAMINSIRNMIAVMSDYEIDNMVVPMISQLSTSSSPTARIVPIALLPDTYLRVSEIARVQVRGMLDRMVVDDNPLVRRAVTSILEKLSLAVGSKKLDWIVHLLEKATSDSHDIVRVFAIKSCVQLASVFQTVAENDDKNAEEESVTNGDTTLHLLHCQMLPLINSYVSDSSWQVRLETTKLLPRLCLLFGKEYAGIFVDYFIGIVQDSTVEVRKAIVETAYELALSLIKIATSEGMQNVEKKADEVSIKESSAEFGSVVDRVSTIQLDNASAQTSESCKSGCDEAVLIAQNKIVRSILPATYCLASDISIEVRLSLARSVGKSLGLIGEHNYAELVPIFTQFLDESQDASVRATLLEETTRNLKGSADMLMNMSRPVIRDLLVSPSWRIRVQSIHCIATWARRLDEKSFPKEFASKYLDLLFDPICEVRLCCCRTLPILIKCLGNDWLIQNVVAAIYRCMRSTFNGRLTGLCLIDSVASELNAAGKLREILELVIEECTSKTPNLRFRALRTLTVIVPIVEDEMLRNHVLDIVRPMASVEAELDPDVRYTATNVLTWLCK